MGVLVIMYAKYVGYDENRGDCLRLLHCRRSKRQQPHRILVSLQDCGYVFTKGPQAWAALPDNYKCPPCGAPKFRFKKVPKGSASGTKVEVKKNWF